MVPQFIKIGFYTIYIVVFCAIKVPKLLHKYFLNPLESNNLHTLYSLVNMSEKLGCTEYGSTETSRFRSVKVDKWREAKSQGLVKTTWVEGIVLCNTCCMNLIENPLGRGVKRVKVMNAEEVSTKLSSLKLLR